jgi:hypothetical protein
MEQPCEMREFDPVIGKLLTHEKEMCTRDHIDAHGKVTLL